MERLDVMTVNVWALPWPFARDRARRFARLARHFATRTYHLVGVQEAWWPFGRVAIPGLRRGGGWPDSGLALGGAWADRAELDLQRFDDAAGADWLLASKGLLRARIGELMVGVTHLQAGDAVRIRLRQLEQLLGWIERDRPTVLLGDFNLGPGDEEAERMLAGAGFRDAVSGPTWLPRNPYAGGREGVRLDRILLRGPWKVVRSRVLPAIWSDHQPVAASIILG